MAVSIFAWFVYRIRLPEVFLEILQNSKKKTFAGVCFLIKLQAEGFNFIEKKFWHWVFPMNFAKFQTTYFLTEHLSWLLFSLLYPINFFRDCWKTNCVKGVQIRSYFSSVFPCISLYSDWIRRFTFEYRKIPTRNYSVFGHFSRSD